MTQSTAELVKAFKANGGKVITIPLGVHGECVEKTFHERLYTPRVKVAFTEAKEDYIRKTREPRKWCHRWQMPVDLAIARNME